MSIRVSVLKAAALGTSFLCIFLGLSKPAAAQTPVYLTATTPDPVGRQMVFELREALRRSAGLSLAERSNDARIYARVVTLDPNEGTSSGVSTIYSAVITFQTFHEPSIEMYLTSYVGNCGRQRVLAGIDEQATFVRGALRDMLDSQRR